MKRIAVVGSLNVDYVSYVAEFPLSGETILSDKFKIVPGGKGANQAFALGRMGADVAMFGALGRDTNAETELESLKSANVDVGHIMRGSEPTGVAVIVVDRSGDNRIIVSQGANAEVSTEYIDRVLPVLERFDIVIFQLEIPVGTVDYAVRRLKEMGKTIILDPAPVSGRLPDVLLENVDFIKPNESELHKLTGIANVEDACESLISRGVGCVLASLGPEGVMVKRPRTAGRRFPAGDVTVVDTTAAGDSFVAAFAFALANSAQTDKAVDFANSVAAFVVQREGAQASIPSKEDAAAMWKRCI